MVVVGRLSLREDKEPQIVVNRVRPMSDYANGDPEPAQQPVRGREAARGTLYLRLPDEKSRLFGKVRAILNMFPGDSNVVLYFADTRQRRGTRAALMENMIRELKNVLGEGNVVIK